MSVANFDDDIRSHLDREASYLAELFSSWDYKTFVELGCDQARLLSLAARFHVNYIGVDSRDDLADYRISFPNNLAISAQFFHGCLSEMPRYLSDRDFCSERREIVLFPFNLFGNLNDPVKILTDYSRHGFDIAISNFNCTSEASRARASYYSRCCDKYVVQCDAPEGVLFTDLDHFHSLAYHENTLKLLLERAGYEVLSTIESETNLFLHCRCNNQPVEVQNWQFGRRGIDV